MAESDGLKDFDAEWYLRTFPDVAHSGLTPQRHYEIAGRALGRPGSPAEAARQRPDAVAQGFGRINPETLPPADINPDSPLIPAPSEIATRPQMAGPGQHRQPALASVILLQSGEVEIGRFAATRTLEARTGPVALYTQMADLAEAAPFQARTGGGTPIGALPLPAPDAARPAMADPLFAEGDARIGGAWYADDSSLRLMLPGPDNADPAQVGRMVRAYGAPGDDTGALTLLSATPLPEIGPGFVDVPMLNPLMPVLLELCDAGGFTQGYALLAFPSLLRGGLHAVERAAHQMAPDAMAEFWRLSDALLDEMLAGPRHEGFSVAGLAVRTAGDASGDATGAERLFQPPVRSWLRGLFGLGLAADGPAPEPGDPGAAWIADCLDDAPMRRGTGLTLSLPPQAVPTLSALVSRRMALPAKCRRAAGPWLIADTATTRPLWSVAGPLSDTATSGQPVLSAPDTTDDAAAHDWIAPLHLAVLFTPAVAPNPACQFLPVALDDPAREAGAQPSGPISVVLTVDAPDMSGAALTALTHQQGITIGEVLVRFASRTSADADNGATFAMVQGAFGKEPVREIAPATGRLDDLDRVAAEADHDLVLFLDADVVLHDPGTLAHLVCGLTAAPEAGTISAGLLHELPAGKKRSVQHVSGGLFPEAVSLLAAPRLTVVEPDVGQALPNAIYPVLANTLALCLMRRAVLEATAPARAALAGPGEGDLHLGLAARAANWTSLCSTQVRASTTRPPSRRDQIDPFGLSCLAPARWDDLLSSITVLRQLRG